ncbi:helix-turn-helix domain-containing protein [Ruficoccus amylovorans]|uniref:Helix-turn-helix domain-containing protein n=1 Tax=Ruficoccus amylovorans TaxID=1804625 RepID=A0A842HH65_9BACT|nr:helix-turn-helix domain-containing protein [Ruficoccus amylovorans]MBC2594581.1 helix-turn-helix domain-containing protein [Ruficoccus amylovorans]
MKQLDPQALCQPETPAPALGRGLAILAALAQDSPQSLESLATRLKLPKASVFRLMATLETLGMVRRTSQKTYEPLWQLQPAADTLTLLRNRLEARMPALCAESRCTIEWYEPGAEGMRLVLQKNPESELCVKVRPGYVRLWGDELEAVARLGYAFYPDAPAPVVMDHYPANGERQPLPLAKVRAQIALARREENAFDPAYNSNAVRRFAIAVIEDGQFAGVLALAEAYHFTQRPGADTRFQQLRDLLA